MNRHQAEATVLATVLVGTGALIGFGASQASGIDQPIIVQQTVTAPPMTVTSTVTMPPRTITVTERASRSSVRIPPRLGNDIERPNPKRVLSTKGRPTGLWLALAKCESGANLRRNTGNGYLGAYQFTQSTWVGYTATRFAPTPLSATWPEQTYVAWRIWAKQKWSAFPGCGVKLGHPSMPAVSAP